VLHSWKRTSHEPEREDPSAPVNSRTVPPCCDDRRFRQAVDDVPQERRGDRKPSADWRFRTAASSSPPAGGCVKNCRAARRGIRTRRRRCAIGGASCARFSAPARRVPTMMGLSEYLPAAGSSLCAGSHLITSAAGAMFPWTAPGPRGRRARFCSQVREVRFGTPGGYAVTPGGARREEPARLLREKTDTARRALGFLAAAWSRSRAGAARVRAGRPGSGPGSVRTRPVLLGGHYVTQSHSGTVCGSSQTSKPASVTTAASWRSTWSSATGSGQLGLACVRRRRPAMNLYSRSGQDGDDVGPGLTVGNRLRRRGGLFFE